MRLVRVRFLCSRAFNLRLAHIFLLLAAAATIGWAQGGTDYTGTGGRHKIQGRIYFPSGRRSDVAAVKVSLDSTASERLSVIADLNGNFAFTSLAPGSYTVTVDAGPDYELASETIYIEAAPISRTMSPTEIARTDVPRIQSVIINLQLKRDHATDAKTSVVNAALAAVPKLALDQYNKALQAIQAGDSKTAVDCLKIAVTYYPEFAIALNELGVQYLNLHEAERAADAFRRALQIKPDDFTPRLNYGIALLEKKNAAEAEAELRQALKLNDNSWTAHLYLGIALISRHNYDEAETELQRALSVGGDKATLSHYYLGGIFWRKGELKRAADELEKYLQLAPKAADAERVRATIKELRARQKS